MKKLLLFIGLLIANGVFAQEFATTDSGKRVELLKNGTYKYVKVTKVEASRVKAADIKIKDDTAFYTNDNFLIENGDEKLTPIKLLVSIPVNAYKAADVDKINRVILEANIKLMYSMKNKRTYVPKKITTILSSKPGEPTEWICAIEYTAQNDYGATKDGKTYFSFDEMAIFKSTF
jgi:hypothetical protein